MTRGRDDGGAMIRLLKWLRGVIDGWLERLDPPTFHTWKDDE